MGRAPCCEKIGLKKGPWTPEEDRKLIAYVKEHGHGSWRALPKKAGLLRCGKSCRLRWTNYLRPDIKRGKFSLTEEQTIIQLHALLGNRWSSIASHLPKRTDNEIKNFWNTHLKKRLLKMGIDPTTHTTKSHVNNVIDTKVSQSATFSHMAQWESARLEAEARLARESKLRSKSIWGSSDSGSSTMSSMSFWSGQACDVSSNGLTSLTKSNGVVDLANMMQSWEKSLQDHVELLWPSASSILSFCVEVGSSCNSPHADIIESSSPTSTLCYLDTHSENAFPACSQLQWDDKAAELEHLLQAQKTIENVKMQVDKSRQLEVALSSNRIVNSGVEANYPIFSSFEDLVIPGKSCSQPYCSSFLSESSLHDKISIATCKKDSEVPALASVSNSATALLGELDLGYEDVTDYGSLCLPLNCQGTSADLLMDSSDNCKFHLEVVVPQHDINSLLSDYAIEEQGADYWSSMLKQLLESSSGQITDGVMIPF